MDEIRFHRASERPHGVFSNLYRRAMEFEGESYPTAEHAYQSGKPRKSEVRAWLLAAPSPSLLAMAAHGLYSWDIAPGWSAGRFERMTRVVRAKFGQHADLAAILLGTGDARLVETPAEDAPVNRRWGEVRVRGQWVGTNWLGMILGMIRTELREA